MQTWKESLNNFWPHFQGTSTGEFSTSLKAPVNQSQVTAEEIKLLNQQTEEDIFQSQQINQEIPQQIPQQIQAIPQRNHESNQHRIVKESIPFSALPTFHGKPEDDVDQWLETLRGICKLSGWSENQEALQILLLLREDAAS